MVISFYGESCFKIENKGVVLTTNPFVLEKSSNNFGQKLFRGKSDIIIYTKYPVSLLSAGMPIVSESFEVKMPGHYEVKDVEIKGWAGGSSDSGILKSFYFLKWDNIKLAIFDDIRKEIPLEAQEDIRESDVILISPFSKDIEIAKKLDSKMIIFGGEKNVFSKEKTETFQTKFSFSKKDLENSKAKIIFLKL